MSTSIESNPTAEGPNDAALELFHPSADLFHDANKFVWLVDLPGVSAQQLDLEVVDRKLVLDATSLRASRRYSRKLKIPPGGDLAQIDASLEKGLLRIEVKKRAELRPRKIALASAS